MDIVSPEIRSKMMSGIRGKNTKPELIVRKELFRRGFRYKLHEKRLPGKPDLVFPRYKAVIQVNGCFWHGHNCKLFKWPKSNQEFWRQKINGTIERDKKNRNELLILGWRVITIWECELKSKSKDEIDRKIDTLAESLLDITPEL